MGEKQFVLLPRQHPESRLCYEHKASQNELIPPQELWAMLEPPNAAKRWVEATSPGSLWLTTLIPKKLFSLPVWIRLASIFRQQFLLCLFLLELHPLYRQIFSSLCKRFCRMHLSVKLFKSLTTWPFPQALNNLHKYFLHSSTPLLKPAMPEPSATGSCSPQCWSQR